MKKISVEQAINSGAWYQYKENEVHLRIRFLSLRPVLLSEFQNIDKVDANLPIKEGKLLLLSTELVNLSKTESGSIYLTLTDNDDFIFNRVDDYYITRDSDFAERNKLTAFRLIPKFKYLKSFIFLVPKEDTKYYLSTQYDATLTEI